MQAIGRQPQRAPHGVPIHYERHRPEQTTLYRLVLRLALQQRLPIIAANVSRADARQVMQHRLAVTGFKPAVPADISKAQAADITDSRCGQINPSHAARMVLAQVARDQAMA